MDNEPQYFQRWAGFFQIENHKTESIAQPEFSRYTFKSFAFLEKTLTITLSAMHQCNQSRLLSLLSMCLGLTMCNLFWYKFLPLTWGSTYFFSSHKYLNLKTCIFILKIICTNATLQMEKKQQYRWFCIRLREIKTLIEKSHSL